MATLKRLGTGLLQVEKANRAESGHASPNGSDGRAGSCWPGNWPCWPWNVRLMTMWRFDNMKETE